MEETPTALVIHRGAIDRTTITTREPAEVMSSVKDALDEMGIEITLIYAHKYRCVRPRRHRPVSSSDPCQNSLDAVVPDSDFESEQQVRPGSQAESSSSNEDAPMTACRNGGCPSQPSALDTKSSCSSVSGVDPGMTMQSNNSSMSDSSSFRASQPLVHPTLYGREPGDEVRFTIELTKIDGLVDTYSLDIRRLKGCSRSYKFVYDALRERIQL